MFVVKIGTNQKNREWKASRHEPITFSARPHFVIKIYTSWKPKTNLIELGLGCETEIWKHCGAEMECKIASIF